MLAPSPDSLVAPAHKSGFVLFAAILVTLVLGAAVLPPLAVVPVAVVFLWAALTVPRSLTAIGAIGASLIRPALDMFGGVAVPLGNPASLFGVLILLWALIVLLGRLYRGLPVVPSRVFAFTQFLLIALHLWLFVAGLLITRTGFLGVEVREFVRFASTLAGGALVVWWVSDRREDGWGPGIAVLVIGSAVPLLTGAIQALTGTGNHEDGNLNRVFGSFTHPLSFGSYLLPLVILGVAAVIHARGALRLTAFGYTCLSAGLLLLTYNRTTMLLLLVGLATYALLDAARVRIRDVVRAAGALAVLCLMGWQAFGDQILERFTGVSISAGAVQEALASGSQNSFQWRIVNWAVLIQLGLSHPVAGHGLGMTTVLNPMIQASSGVPFNAHNDYVRYFFEGGAVGLTLYVSFIVALGAWLWRVRQRCSRADRTVAIAIIAALASLFIFSAGTTEMSLQTGVLYPTQLLMAILVGAEIRATGQHEDAAAVHQQYQDS
jgi:O-antigen ligase